MAHKNDYTVIVFQHNKPYKYTYVHNLNKFSQFVWNNFPGWSAMNVYDRRTKKFLKQFKPGDSIPKFL